MSNPKQTKRDTPVSRETLITMVETFPGTFFFLDDTDTIVYANASAQTLTGATPEVLVGNSFWRSAPHLVSTALYQAVQKTKQTREPTEVAYVSPVTNTWLHISLSPTDEGLAIFFQKNLEPPHLQDGLSRNDQMYRDLLESVADGVTIVTPEGLVLDINQRPLADAHLRREEAVGKPLTGLPAWSSDPAVQQHLRAAIATASQGETVRFEARIHPRTDLSLDILMTITAHRDASQQVEYLICAGRDITERKHAEDELRTLVDAIPHFVWIMRPDGSCDYCNQQWCDYTTMTPEQLQGDRWIACLHPADRQRTLDAWQTAVRTQTLYEVEYRMQQGRTGAYRWFLARGMPRKDSQGTILHWFGTCTDIDEQKRAEQRLKTSEENWRVLAETVPQLVWTAHVNGRLDYMNQRSCDYAHTTREGLLGDGWSQFLHPDDAERTLAVRAHAFRTGIPYEVEYRLREGQTGRYRWFLVRGMPVRDDAGQIVKWFGTCTDIEDQKRAEQQIKASEENWRVLAETVPQLVWTRRPDGQFEYMNQRWRDYSGLTVEQTQNDRWAHLQFLHPDDQEGNRALLQHALDTGEMYEHEERLRNSQTGTYRWFLTRAMPVRNEAGELVKWFGTCTDIDEQKRTEQRLKESEENWQTLAETVPQLVWRVQPDGEVDYVNQRACDYAQTTREQLLGHGWHYLLHPDDKERERVTLDHAFRTGIPYEVKFRLREGQTGCYRWFLTRGMPVCDETGQLVKWFGTCTDIEDQKRIEEALRQSQERIRALIDSNIIGIVSVEGEEEVLVEANEAFLHMTGYTQEDMRNRTLTRVKITPPEHAPFFQRAIQEVNARGRHTPLETEVICKDGSRLSVLVGSVTFQKRPRQNISFVLDNSARKELEQRKDDFISMASHELRNPLAAVKMQTQLVQKRLERQSHHEAATALSRVEGPVKQLERLIAELLDVSKIQAGRLEYLREAVELDALLHEVADTMQQISPTHTIVVRGAAPRSLVGDKDRLGQVFTNLLSNAIKYSPDAETVEMDLSASEETVTVRVHDHGLGIPREQRDKIFERFYRASGPKQRAIPGLGMGLYIVAEIVKRHGGTITVDSEVGKGSTFIVTLPRKRDA